MAEEAKAKGNAAFSSKNYQEAITHFTEAITLSPTNHVLYSNRSAAHASLGNFSAALSDAEKTVSLKPDWGKGYSRLGAAHLGLHNIPDAIAAYKKGLEIDPSNDALKSGLEDAKRAARPGPSNASPFGDAFSGPEMWAKLTADPTTRVFLQQPDYVKMMQDLQRNPSNLNLYLQDQRVMKSLGVLLNIKMRTAGEDGDFSMSKEEEKAEEKVEVNEKKKVEEKAVPMEEEEEVVLDETEKEKKARKAAALKEKELGTAAYKKKDFETAVEHYSKAFELDDEDISYLTNRAAVYLEMGKVSIFKFYWLRFFLICLVVVVVI